MELIDMKLFSAICLLLSIKENLDSGSKLRKNGGERGRIQNEEERSPANCFSWSANVIGEGKSSSFSRPLFLTHRA
uniref:Uncharacterized protein n=1 Tax=Solanum lycopersicum TaxID=4081 RepID=A0A3Q7H4L9_SOLLC